MEKGRKWKYQEQNLSKSKAEIIYLCVCVCDFSVILFPFVSSVRVVELVAKCPCSYNIPLA